MQVWPSAVNKKAKKTSGSRCSVLDSSGDLKALASSLEDEEEPSTPAVGLLSLELRPSRSQGFILSGITRPPLSAAPPPPNPRSTTVTSVRPCVSETSFPIHVLPIRLVIILHNNGNYWTSAPHRVIFALESTNTQLYCPAVDGFSFGYNLLVELGGTCAVGKYNAVAQSCTDHAVVKAWPRCRVRLQCVSFLFFFYHYVGE